MRNLITCISVSAILAFASCSPTYYIPNTQNVPLLSEKGETNLNLSGNGDQVNFQGAYGLSDNFGLMVNGGLFIPSDEDNGNGGSGEFVEFGGGYFTKVSENFVFETYGIFGFGSLENHLPSTTQDYPLTKGDISSNVFRYGIQPSFGYKSTYFSASVSSRFMNLNYSNISGDLIYDNEVQTDYLKDNSSNFLIEPALTVRGGTEKFKLQIQYGYSVNLSNDDFRQENSFLTLGLNFNFK